MDANRFDSISRLFAGRRTRRAAVGGGLGLAAAAIGGRALAQGATPAPLPDDPHPSADTNTTKTELLFIQPFDSGTWAPKDDVVGAYTLTLSGAAANTIYFSDRPERIVGLTPTQRFLDRLGFTPANPPNAAIVAHDEAGEQDILVIELLNPVYDAGAGALTYDATVLADYGEPGLAYLARQQQDYELPESFGAGSLFIDSVAIADCGTLIITCTDSNGNEVGSFNSPCVSFDYTSDTCGTCDDPAKYCADKYGACSRCTGFDANGKCFEWENTCDADWHSAD